MSKRYGTKTFQRSVYASYPGGEAEVLEATPKQSLGIEDTMTNNLGQTIEEFFDEKINEITLVLGIPADFEEPDAGDLLEITLASGAVSYVVLSKERAEKAREYVRLTVTARNKEYVEYGTGS